MFVGIVTEERKFHVYLNSKNQNQQQNKKGSALTCKQMSPSSELPKVYI